MTLCCRLVNSLEAPTVHRAVIAHWAFETIHPYVDGNGRIGRLIMNLLFGSEGWPWVTIVADDRTEYFDVLQRAQVDEDFDPLGRFLATRADRAWQAASNLLKRAQGGTANQ
jgi:Fic family protein